MKIITVSGKAGSGKDEVADTLVKEYGFVKIALADPIKRIALDIYDFSIQQLWGPSQRRNEEDKRYCRGGRLPCGCVGTIGMNVWRDYSWEQSVHLPGVEFKAGDIHGGFWVYEILESCEKHPDRDWVRGRTFPAETPLVPAFLTPRMVLQKLGTEMGRTLYENTWLDYWWRTARKLYEGKGYAYDHVLGLRMLPQVAGVMTVDAPQGVVVPDVRFSNELAFYTGRAATCVYLDRPGAGLSGAAAKHASENIPSPDRFSLTVSNDKTLEDLRSKTRGLAAAMGLQTR